MLAQQTHEHGEASKAFTESSRLGYFHLSTIGIDYGDTSANDLAIQNVLFFKLAGDFRLAGGAFHTERGFSPTVGTQCVRAGKDLFILFAPRVNIESDPCYSILSIVRYKPKLTEHTRLYLGLQLLNAFDANRHIKSHQWLRVGLEIKGTQSGLAVNFDEDEQRRILRVGACLTCHEPTDREIERIYRSFDESLTRVTPRCLVP